MKRRGDGKKGAGPNAARVDPYLEWAVATNFAYLGGETIEWYPVLLELETSAAAFALKVARAQNRIRIPSIYRRLARDIHESAITFCMALVHRNELVAGFRNSDELAKRGIRRFELGVPLVPVFRPSPTVELAALATNPPRSAIVAVIDDGLAFANERFRNAVGATRFKYFWNQDDATGINSPPEFKFWGRELKETEINLLLAACTHCGIVDEDEFYRRAGQTIAARRAKHGTHVMDLACGMDPQQAPVGSPPYLIGVQLPHWVTMETSGATLTPMVKAAIAYILNRADEIAAQENTAPLPVVINLSYGNIEGPHDGTAPLEAAIDQFIAARPGLRVVLPAGNAYLARCHACFDMPQAQTAAAPIESLLWRIQPDNQSCSFMTIWLPHSAAVQPLPQVEVRITTPDGATSPWIGQNSPPWNWPTPNDVRFSATYIGTFLPGERPRISLAMSPTAQVTTNPLTAPSGTWRIEVKNTGRAITVDAWSQRNDTPFGYPLRGRQSRFDDAQYVRFDLAGRPEEQDIGPSSITRAGTINALATGQQTIVIGGFRRDDYTASDYSGAGPIVAVPGVPPWRDGPDATAVADDSVALNGVLNAGTRTSSVFALDGTSVGAPQVTRLIAQRMIAGLQSDRAAVQGVANPNNPLPPNRGGAGRIETPPRNPKRWTRWP